MGYQLEHNKTALPKIAGAAIAADRAVVIDDTGADKVIEADRGDGPILGVSKAEADAAGDGVAVQTEGIRLMVASETIDEGDLVTVTDDGTLAIYDTTGDYLLGQAQTGAAANGYVAVLIKPGTAARA